MALSAPTNYMIAINRDYKQQHAIKDEKCVAIAHTMNQMLRIAEILPCEEIIPGIQRMLSSAHTSVALQLPNKKHYKHIADYCEFVLKRLMNEIVVK